MNNSQEIGCFLYEAIKNNNNFLNHQSIVLVGNNSVGKTKSLKELFSNVKKEKDKSIYYIDSQNRVITDNHIGENTICKQFADFDVLEIVDARTSDDNMAQHDVFTKYEAGPITAISELIQNIDVYSDLFSNTIGMTVTIPEKIVAKTELAGIVETSKRERILINDTNQQIETLSSSEASKMRILMEIRNASIKKCKAVVIDEFDIHFDNDQISQFIEIIQKTFPLLRFVFVIHDPETLVNINDMDALIYNIDGENGIHKIIDTNDIREIAQVHRLRAKYLGRKEDESIILEECISKLVEEGSLSEGLVSQYMNINVNTLTSKEKVWYSYVKKRIENAC